MVHLPGTGDLGFSPQQLKQTRDHSKREESSSRLSSTLGLMSYRVLIIGRNLRNDAYSLGGGSLYNIQGNKKRKHYYFITEKTQVVTKERRWTYSLRCTLATPKDLALDPS